jgi:hypothetical protein
MDADMRRERIMWLRTLVSAYREEHDWDGDIDPGATDDMLRACEALAGELEAGLPGVVLADVPAAAWGDDIPL